MLCKINVRFGSKLFISNQFNFQTLSTFNSFNHNNSLSHFKLRPYYSYVLKKSNLCSYHTNVRKYSSENKRETSKSSQNIETNQSSGTKDSQKIRLKKAFRDYGATIVIFHVAISLASLGICYTAISNGVDAVRLLTFLGFSESLIASKVAIGGSTFVIAYAVHKVFAPVRIGITLSVAPFIVRYLRKIKWLKPSKKAD